MDKVLLNKRINEILNKNGYIRVSELAKEFNITESSMNYTLKKEGYREKDIFIQLPKGYIRSFEEVNEETSYWLGYLQADGCINSSGGRPRLILECKSEDRELLENFCDFTKINKKRIKDTQHKNLSGSISFSVRLDLYKTSFSIFPDKWLKENKSLLDEELPKDVIFYDYLLGLIDGDGGFYEGKRGSQLKLLCRESMLSQIINQLEKDLPQPTSIWTKEHPKTKGLYELIIGNGKNNNNFKFLYNQFYLNKNYNSLKRKKEKLEQIIA